MLNYDWFGNVLTPNIQKAIKDFAGDKNYDDLITQSTGSVSDQFTQHIMGHAPASTFRRDILTHGGVDIIDAGVTDIRPNEEFERALKELANAQIQAESTVVSAEARKRAAILDGEGEAEKIKAIARAEEERLDRTTFRTAREGERATNLERWRHLSNSKLTTYFESGAPTGILVGTDGKPISS
jgi:regulator of protease activity HflC (stomatin/prohibitin superfamily)